MVFYEAREIRGSAGEKILRTFFVNDTSIFRSNYLGMFNEELARYLIEMFTNPRENVVDPMCGSGTIPRVANQLGRAGVGSDINEDALKIAKELDPMHDCRYQLFNANHLSYLDDGQVDLILTSPTFGISIDAKHERHGEEKEDFANSASYEEWREKFKPCLCEFYRVVQPGHICIIETRPRRTNWESKRLWDWIMHDAENIGFKWFDTIIEIQQPYSKVSSGNG